MSEAQQGDVVKVHYTGKLQDGNVFDTSVGRDPLEFTLGRGEVIPGFEEAVVGMSPGETKTSSIPAEKAYGPREEERLVTVPRQDLPEHIEPEVGQRLRIQSPDGSSIGIVIAEVTEDAITFDANHPLAGEELIFEIELVEIR